VVNGRRSRLIKTGQMIQVDGDNGRVTLSIVIAPVIGKRPAAH
jgi:hypothetical protein